MDAKTGEELRHPKGECVVPGMVVVKIIYTPEEALRRKEEDREVRDAFRKTNKQVRVTTAGGRSLCRMPALMMWTVVMTHASLDQTRAPQPCFLFRC